MGWEGAKSTISLILGIIVGMLGAVPLMNKAGWTSWSFSGVPKTLLLLLMIAGGLYLIVDGFLEVSMTPALGWVRILIGLVALAGGGYNLKEYFTTPAAVCKVTDTDKRQKFFERLKNIAHHPSFLLAFGGIILLAFAVNLVELICSAGLPAVYTQILALNDLTKLQYYLYIFFYIFIFMLDDLFVFFAAMITLRMTGMTTKYSHWSHLIGGILMVIIGLLLIFKPELLMLG